MMIGDRPVNIPASDPGLKKWRACDPTSPHWYDRETFGRLVAALIHKDPNRPIRDFLGEFDGLSSTSRRSKILNGLDLNRASLSNLLRGDEPHGEAIAALLQAMQAETKPVDPRRLGLLGEDNLRRLGGEAFRYAKKMDVDEKGFPYVIEGAFSYDPDPDEEQERTLIIGANFASSPGLTLNLRTWESASSVLEGRFASADKPIGVFLHVIHPRLTFTDLGKTEITLSRMMAEDLRWVMEKITQPWYEQHLRELKDSKAAQRRRDALERAQNKKMTVKDAVYKHLPEAYERASGGIAARSHQIFYQLRPLVLPEIEKDGLDSQYVEQTLIPNFVSEHPEITANWVILYDDRGHAIEPHTGRTIGLGTKNVRSYCASWGPPTISSCELSPPKVTTCGPGGRYGAILFCEKEGFTEIFRAARLEKRFDVMLMSTKGTSVTAAREMFEETARKAFEEALRTADRLGGIPIFALTDFDYNGFEIRATLYQDTRRYHYQHRPNVIDVDLRLADVKRLGLESERVVRPHKKEALEANLRKYGATEEEIAFLLKREYQGSADDLFKTAR
jgi:hypothetical protein